MTFQRETYRFESCLKKNCSWLRQGFYHSRHSGSRCPLKWWRAKSPVSSAFACVGDLLPLGKHKYAGYYTTH
ncbi:hypothetical protein HanRHA438_Chr11g0529611 [Helianthus annuus]|nr:hypothetical protein HanRHA438_Chr11g0529611 [Helianthus annuus]